MADLDVTQWTSTSNGKTEVRVNQRTEEEKQALIMLRTQTKQLVQEWLEQDQQTVNDLYERLDELKARCLQYECELLALKKERDRDLGTS